VDASEGGLTVTTPTPSIPGAPTTTIYLASSWRNPYHSVVLAELRKRRCEVYDFKTDGHAMAWKDLDPELATDLTADRLQRVLQLPGSDRAFAADMNAMKWADACVLLLPCGLSAHLEAGWFAGKGKPVAVLAPELREPELMYKMFERNAVFRDGAVTPIFGLIDQVADYLSSAHLRNRTWDP